MGTSSKKQKKRSRDSSRRKKNRRNESKKLIRRRDDSDSSKLSSSESSSCSYSSSEEDYKRRKGRSRGKAGEKLSSKRARRRYSSSESDDDSGRLKRKRRSKRKDGYVGKKRTRTRKKHRRDVTVNSASSESYSTCPSQRDSGSSGESEVETKRGKFEKRGKSKRSRESSKGCSSCSQNGEADDYHHVMDGFKSSKRLRSVITVVTASNGDEGEDKMVYGRGDDHDDYPSCRINDSNGGGSKRESERHEASVENNIECREKVEAIISSPRMGVDEEQQKGDVEIETNQTPDPGNSSKGEDLEAILRVRALENLRRFRGDSQRNAVTSKEVSTAAEGEPLEVEPTKGEESVGCHVLEQTISVSVGKTDLESSQKVQDVVGDGMKESGTVLHDLTSPGDQRSGGSSKEKASTGVGSCMSRPKLIRPVLRLENSSHSSTSKQATETQDSQAQLTSGDTIDKSRPESSRMPAAINRSENVKGRDANDTPKGQSSSFAETLSGRGELDKSQDENKEGSQFEQKTMSVMRGGEMVQVSYKVYIPQKTPALARRKLKR